MSKSESISRGLCLIAGPLLMAISTFFWQNDGRYSPAGGTFVALSTLFWIIGWMALFEMAKTKMPRYAAWGLLVAIFGCISGSNFGFADFYSYVFKIPHEVYLQRLAEYPISSNILLFQSGPLFPLSLLVLGFVFMKIRVVPLWVSILICAGAILFPLSRISRIPNLAHASDLLMLLPMVFIGWNYLKGNLNTAKITR
jgi:hypothetical protein